jgi:predicted O-methyltransferase YrrM
MGFGAYLAHVEGYISEEEMNRIHKVISDCELTLYHPVMDDHASVWKAHLGIIEKRGGNLCAPVPKPLGKTGYINDLTEEQLYQRLNEYKVLASKYPRNGLGVDPHCADVGLEDPQEKKKNPMQAEQNRPVMTPADQAVVSLGHASGAVLTDKKAQSNIKDAYNVIGGIDSMSAKYSTQPSAELKKISGETLSGQVEGQLLQMLVRFGRVKNALDIGTFTGYSALAVAEALPDGGSVTSLEKEADAAHTAAANWASSPHAAKIKSLVGDAGALLRNLAAEKQSFDLVFLDADKANYKSLYEQLMDTGLLAVGGLLVVDNTMYKGEELLGKSLSEDGEGARNLNQALLADSRVSQVMLPLADGVTLVQRLS